MYMYMLFFVHPRILYYYDFWGLSIILWCSGTTDQFVEAVSLLRERAEKDEPNSLYSLVNDLSKVVLKFRHVWDSAFNLLFTCTGAVQEVAQ